MIYLEFRDHARFRIIRGRHVLYESFGQHLAVKLLEDIFVFYVLEDDHLKKQSKQVSNLQKRKFWTYECFVYYMI